jgi:hypothetical protein
MNRLQAELHRLYLPQDASPALPASPERDLVGTDGTTRAVVLEFARPGHAQELLALWQAVQRELDLPAPAISVSGCAGYQLWFSLAQAVPAAQAVGFVAALRDRYLGGIAPEGIRLRPGAGEAAHDRIGMPPAPVAPERWSAFVAPDLAPLFADEPWLDQPPGAEAQADLLSRIESILPEAFARASAQLLQAGTRADAPAVTTRARALDQPTIDPRQFLLAVMQDPSVDLRWRIEAAKALLPQPPVPGD